MHPTRRWLAALLAALMALTLTACTSPQPSLAPTPTAAPTAAAVTPAPSADPAAQADFDAFLEQVFVEELSEADTLTVHYLLVHPEVYGLSLTPATLGDLSVEDEADSRAETEDLLEELRGHDRAALPEDRQVTYDVLEDYLEHFPGAVMAVSHDRYFLDNVAGWILELDRGKGIPWKGNYSSWLDQKQKRLAQEEKADHERQKTLARELEWIHMSAKGRHAKGKARINAYEAMLSHESERLAPDLEIYIPPGPRLGKTVIEAKDLTKSMGDKVLLDKTS